MIYMYMYIHMYMYCTVCATHVHSLYMYLIVIAVTTYTWYCDGWGARNKVEIALDSVCSCTVTCIGNVQCASNTERERGGKKRGGGGGRESEETSLILSVCVYCILLVCYIHVLYMYCVCRFYLVFAVVCIDIFSCAWGRSPIPFSVKQCSVSSLPFTSFREPCVDTPESYNVYHMYM